MYVFAGDQILISYLRPSSVGAAHHARGVTKLLVRKIRSRWPNVKILVRGDSGYAVERLMRWCDKNDVGYIFGLQKIAARVRVTCRRVVFHLSSHCPSQTVYERVLQRLCRSD